MPGLTVVNADLPKTHGHEPLFMEPKCRLNTVLPPSRSARATEAFFWCGFHDLNNRLNDNEYLFILQVLALFATSQLR